MDHVDINELHRLEMDFFKNDRPEWNRISRCCRAIERMLVSNRAAFEALGSPVDDQSDEDDIHTAFLSAITPARLEAAAPQIDALRAFFDKEWRKATGRRARVLLRAARDCEAAVDAIRTRLAELQPLMQRQDFLVRQLEHALMRLQQAAKENACKH